jgi:putative membrane protein insertion efficiency factor
MRTILRLLDRALCKGALFLIHGYQRWLGWLLGGQCRFVPSCSCYGEEAFHRGPFHWALLLTIWRILRCQPLCKGGFDPVPDWMDQPHHPNCNCQDPPKASTGTPPGGSDRG